MPLLVGGTVLDCLGIFSFVSGIQYWQTNFLDVEEPDLTPNLVPGKEMEQDQLKDIK